MRLHLKQEFDEIFKPFDNAAASFFLAASLYHAHKISFTAAAALADLNFEAFLSRLQEHFDTCFLLSDKTVLEDIDTVAKMMDRQ